MDSPARIARLSPSCSPSRRCDILAVAKKTSAAAKEAHSQLRPESSKNAGSGQRQAHWQCHETSTNATMALSRHVWAQESGVPYFGRYLGGIYCKVASCGIIAVDGYINVCMKWQILQGQGFSTNSRCLVWNQRGAGGAERIWGGGASTSDRDISHRGSPIRPARWCSWAYCDSTALGSLSVICRQQHRDVSLRSGSCLPLSLPWCKNFAAFWAAPMFGPEDAGAGGVSAGFSPQKQDRFRSAGAQRARQGNGGQSAIHCIAAARQSFPSLVMLFWLSKGRRCRWKGGGGGWIILLLERGSTGQVHSSEALVLAVWYPWIV